jgi:hypothetical protein
MTTILARAGIGGILYQSLARRKENDTGERAKESGPPAFWMPAGPVLTLAEVY